MRVSVSSMYEKLEIAKNDHYTNCVTLIMLALSEGNPHIYLTFRGKDTIQWQWRSQDFKEGGAQKFARKPRPTN